MKVGWEGEGRDGHKLSSEREAIEAASKSPLSLSPLSLPLPLSFVEFYQFGIQSLFIAIQIDLRLRITRPHDRRFLRRY